jgi:D-sedoheptulose 7-phosphate isomerase
VALTADGATILAIANDCGFEHVFARQVDALARPNDVLIAMSTSGNSPNVLAAANRARAAGCLVIGLSAGDGGRLAAVSHLLIAVPSPDVTRIQELHLVCVHALVEAFHLRLKSAQKRRQARP